MAIAKVTLNGVTQMDVTGKTVTPATLGQGATALKNDGTDITGTMTAGIMTETELKNWIQRDSTFTGITWPSGMTNIGAGAFYECTKFNTSSLPSGITSISNYAFYNCSKLALTSLPSTVTSIGAYAFWNCTSLTISSLPSGVTNLQSNVFAYCSGLTTLSLHNGITDINGSAFAYCYNLEISTLPSSVCRIYSNAFYCCEKIEEISCTGTITTMGSNAFTGTASHPMILKSASFPNLNMAGFSTVFGSTTASYACQQLEFVDLGSVSSFNSNAFANCYSLEKLVLRKSDAICTLSNVNTFTNTPFSGYNSKTGTVYVPNALISSYQNATNWSTLYNNGTLTFAKIEGSDYDLS